jgi:hypothetical protein
VVCPSPCRPNCPPVRPPLSCCRASRHCCWAGSPAGRRSDTLPAITIMYCRLPRQLPHPVAVTVKVKLPLAIGVPVAELRFKLAGNVPELTANA